ncbi:MAG: hypothetical protein ACKOTD_11060 [Phycisphaerales bacterium]
MALSAWGLTHDQEVPHSRNVEPASLRPQELMAARMVTGAEDPERGWDGLGLLVRDGFIGPGQCRCLHCGSHRGEHSYERYADAYGSEPKVQIYTNYHYAGHLTYQYESSDPLDDGEAAMRCIGVPRRGWRNRGSAHGSGLRGRQAGTSRPLNIHRMPRSIRTSRGVPDEFP